MTRHHKVREPIKMCTLNVILPLVDTLRQGTLKPE